MRTSRNSCGLVRRQVLQSLGAVAGAAAMGLSPVRAADEGVRAVRLRPKAHPKGWWTYGSDAQSQHPLRLRPNTPYEVVIDNQLPVDTSIHWHGQRVENAMDGVPGLTQDPIAPGETLRQLVSFPDPGTYWYHPHLESHEAVGRGLISPLIIEEEVPVAVDHDLTALVSRHWIASDGSIAPNFNDRYAVTFNQSASAHWFVNGAPPRGQRAMAGDIVRLRLVNGAAMSPMTVKRPKADVVIAAIDGHPLASPLPFDDELLFHPGQRYDLLFVMPPRDLVVETDAGDPLVMLSHQGSAPGPQKSLPILPKNPIATPVLEEAKTVSLTIGRRAPTFGQRLRARWNSLQGTLDLRGYEWLVNGDSLTETALCTGDAAPLFFVRKGQTVILRWENLSVNDHPIHIHGHSCFTLNEVGGIGDHGAVRDTVILPGNSSVQMAFVADNPGRWMIHCHDLRHQVMGFMGYFAVV